jgi:uncharacterized protein (TIGR02147 family)
MLNQENIKRIEITDYNDYVPYIRDLVNYKKETSAFSFRVFCHKSGFRSPSYLKWVIEGTRPISLRSVHKFIQGLGLTKRDAKYFLIMVNYKEAKDPHSKRFYYEEMLEWKKRQSSTHTKDAYEYLSHWYYLAIRELVGSKEFKDDPRWISDRLGGNLTVWDVKNSLETLERLKLIEKNAQGQWQQTTRNLHTEPEVHSLAAFSYHAEMLDVAESALTKRTANERSFQSLVAMIDDKTYDKLKEKIQNFQQELIVFLEGEEKLTKPNRTLEELYAVNMQMVPLTVRRKGEK